MLVKLYVANVGVNTASRGRRSPVFPDGTFEFVPIKESSVYAVEGVPTYDDIPVVSGRTASLAAYVPAKVAGYAVHNDPEFTTYTYGDILSSRASNLRKIEPGDELWFLARLWDHDGERWFGTSDFYFVGRLSVEHNVLIPADTLVDDIPPHLQERIRNNAHYNRLALAGSRGAFRVIIGDGERSARFRRAIKVTPEVVALLYAAKYDSKRDRFLREGQVLRNRSNAPPRTFSYFGSATRAIQSFLDSSREGDRPSIDALMELAGDHQ